MGRNLTYECIMRIWIGGSSIHSFLDSLSLVDGRSRTGVGSRSLSRAVILWLVFDLWGATLVTATSSP